MLFHSPPKHRRHSSQSKWAAPALKLDLKILVSVQWQAYLNEKFLTILLHWVTGDTWHKYGIGWEGVAEETERTPKRSEHGVWNRQCWIEEDHTCSSLFSKLLQSNSGAQGRKMDLQGSWCDSVVTTLLKLVKKAYLSNFCFKWYKV